ncbi:MAG: fasciclin domain-containing protein [Paludibacter sp.]|jgi:hypothetical protein|nr:fasciclin domain-containing protein [Paludibacter sp.]
MKTQLIKHFLPLVLVLVLFSACDRWGDASRLNNANTGKNLNEIIGETSEISKFAQILELTGYSDLLTSDNSFTVFAPKNEAIQNLDLSNIDALKTWVQNYIVQLTWYVDSKGLFAADSLLLLNGKYVPLGISSVSGSNIVKSNIQSANGVLHIIDNIIIERLNIYDYLLLQTGYEQINFIKDNEKNVMDSERSIQIGVDINGKPVFDTIWTTSNPFIDNFPLQNERRHFTVILLERSAIDNLRTKYAKYLHQDSISEQNYEVIKQITEDMILKKTAIETAGRYENFDNVLVDINPADIVESYQASNGFVYKVSNVDVKFYHNKIKEQIIEAEDFVSNWDAAEQFVTRYRSYASGGKDVALKGYTNWYYEYSYYDPTGDSIIHATRTPSIVTTTLNNPTRAYNSYLRYNPTMYSTSYEMYWLSYDDIAEHTRVALNPDTIRVPLVLQQKMLLSLPGKPALIRESDGTIKNNFNSTTCFAAQDTAGILKERQLIRYRKLDSNTASLPNLFVLRDPYLFADPYGEGGTLICANYGQATIFITNTCRDGALNASNASRYPGLIFLDYIRLVPLVDPND